MSDKHAKQLRRQRRLAERRPGPRHPAPEALLLPPPSVPPQRTIPVEQRAHIAHAVQEVLSADAEITGMDPTFACEAYARVSAIVLNTLALEGPWWRVQGQILPYAVQVGSFIVQPDPAKPEMLTGFSPAGGANPRPSAIRTNTGTQERVHMWIGHRLDLTQAEMIDFSASNYLRWIEHGVYRWRWPTPPPPYLWVGEDELPPWIDRVEADRQATIRERHRIQPGQPAYRVFVEQWKIALQALDMLGARPTELSPLE